MRAAGLLVSVAFVAVLVYFAFGRSDAKPTSGSDPTSPTASATLGAPPPTDIAQNAQAAKDYTRRQACLSGCASEERTCKTLAADEAASEVCVSKKSECEGRCP